jgi:hypothetical protein
MTLALHPIPQHTGLLDLELNAVAMRKPTTLLSHSETMGYGPIINHNLVAIGPLVETGARFIAVSPSRNDLLNLAGTLDQAES